MPRSSKSAAATNTTTTTLEISIPAEVEQSSRTIVDLARQLTITNTSELAAAAAFRKECIVAPLKLINAECDPNIKRWREGHAEAIASKRKWQAPFLLAQTVIDAAIDQYHKEVKRLQVEQARLIAAAQQEEAERAAVAAAADLISRGGDGDEVAAAEILQSVSAGAIIPATAPPPMIPQPPKVEGISVRQLLRWKVVNVNLIKPEFKLTVADEEKIGAIVKALEKGAEDVVGKGGIEVYFKSSVADH